MAKAIANFNIRHLLKEQLIIYNTGRCNHGKLYSAHPACFQREIIDNNKKIKIGMFDIENFGMNFKANNGFIITYYLKEFNKEKYYYDYIKYKDLYNKKIRDKNIVKNLIRDLNRFDVIVTYNGTYHDFPYVRTRALMHKINFLKYGEIKHIDLYFLIKSKFKLNRNSLKIACESFKIKGKTCVNLDVWIDAILGDRKALMNILDHNKGDVTSLNELYNKIYKYSRKINRSI